MTYSEVENQPSQMPITYSTPSCSSIANNNNNNTSLATHQSVAKPSSVLLGTAKALIKNALGQFVTFRLLIDCASTASFITKSLATKLSLPVEPCSQVFSGLSNNSVGTSSGLVSCVIKPLHVNYPPLQAKAFIIETILPKTPLVSLPPSVQQFVSGLQLADPDFFKSQEIDMLLGCDILPRILSTNAVPPHHSEIGVLPTIFGHVVIGNIPVNFNLINNPTFTSLLTYPEYYLHDDYLQKSVERFWESEKVTLSPAVNPADDYCEQQFIKSHSRDETGRFTVEMPFKKDPSSVDFYESKQIAFQRFYSLENRFRKNPSLKFDCINFLKEYEALGHMTKASRPGKYFIPYFCIFNSNSPTTPVRVVFDGSAKGSHLSINDVLHAGPKLQREVPDVLLNFRVEPLVFCCDVSKMYRQINVQDDQRVYQHILFRADPTEPLEEYELGTLTYGLSPSAFCSQRCLIQLVHDEGDKYPLAAPVILNNSVVDDLFAGAKSVSSLLEIKDQLSSLLSSGCFPLNKWLSNCPEFLETLTNSDSNGNLIIRNSHDLSVKVLGVGWDPKLDVFFFSLDTPPLQNNYTKRQVLSAIARIYDPLGFASPVIFLFKCLLKDIWLTGVDWDEPISPSLTIKWHTCLSEFAILHQIKVPRCLFPLEPLTCHIMGFSDASEKGSAAVLYLRIMYQDLTVKVFLLKSKTRVAPTKGHTIPRLELIGAVLLTNLVNSVQKFLVTLPIPCSIYLFSDSTVVLSWIRTPPHLLKLYVANRIASILEHSSPSQWFHVSSENNAADCASRGLTPSALKNTPSWVYGPQWAYAEPHSWPVSAPSTFEIHGLPETKPVVLATTNEPVSEHLSKCLTSHSKLVTVQRIAAYMLRFLHNVKHPLNRRLGYLSVSELKAGLLLCVRHDQTCYFKEELVNLKNNIPCSNKILKLTPFVDKDGLIRVGGRLQNSSLSLHSKHPILLHNKSNLTELLINYYHQAYLHAGVRTLQALLMNKYWIINCKQTVKRVIYKCVRCSKFRRNTTADPLMGNLPKPRVTPSHPFLNCGVDLAGPFILKESSRRNCKTYKAYFALFICFAVKAVHLEVLTSLSADCFIAALSRFASRRGSPAHIYCDQGTNFKGASRQLSAVVEFLRSENTNKMISAYLASQNIDFHFNVPRAPFMSGLAESNVKNVKYHLIRSVGSQVLTLEEFHTVTAKIEAILNSRPLCSLSDSPDDYSCLTPAHFLVGSSLICPPEDNLEEVPIPRLSRWQLVSQITQSFWRRWEAEYLNTLQTKSKWFTPSPNLEPGQLAWLHEDNTPPLFYPLCRIKEVHPGLDGVVRAVTVQTGSGTYRRPARKLALLPSQ